MTTETQAAIQRVRDALETRGCIALEDAVALAATPSTVELILAELDRLKGIENAAKNLVKVKGRYHTEQAFKALMAAMKEG